MKYTAEQLNEKIYGENGYFEWVQNNPFYKYDVVKTGEKAGQELKIKVDRMPSIQGLCFHLDIDEQLFYVWVNNAMSFDTDREDLGDDEVQNKTKFFDIVIRANNQIKRAQIEGAGSGLYQPMIAARLNKLKDTQEVQQTNIDATDKTEDEIRAAMEAIRNARKK